MSRNRHIARAAYRGAAAGYTSPGTSTLRSAPRAQARTSATSASVLDLGILIFIALAILTLLTLSSTMLTHLKIQYVTAGGNFYEKLHPATYFVVLALGLALLRSGNPIHQAVRITTQSKAIPFYVFCWALLLVQTLMLERPFTAVVDTFLLPVLLALAIWQMSSRGRSWLALLLHVLILLNVAIGYYEYFAGQRIIPLTLGTIVVLGEWRSAALLGHPLTASGLVAGYVLALMLRPQICPQPLLRLALILFCFGSLMVFGGRTALVTTLAIVAAAALFELLRLLRGGRVSLPMLIVSIALFFVGLAAVFAILDLGIFDKMLLRFSSDKGSALARFATLDLLSYLDWHEIMFGPTVARANALQNQLGLDYGIENFWIACIVQFGLVHTALMTGALGAFFAALLQRSSGAAWALMALMLIIAASSVSFSSKNIQLAQFVILITILLPRSGAAKVPSNQHLIRSPVRARPVHAGSVS